jgi:hypothetical protein
MDAQMDDRVFGLVSNRVRWAGTPSSSTLALRTRPIVSKSVLELERTELCGLMYRMLC